MRTIAITILSLTLLLSLTACSKADKSPDTVSEQYADKTLNIIFTDGIEHSGYQKAYAIWMEGESGFFRNIYICSRIKKQDLTGTALPYWQLNKRELASRKEIDAVTGATISDGDFTETVSLAGAPDKFTVYYEIDHSFDPNEWFDDQPAILYKIDVDLSTGKTEFDSEFIGWTANEYTDNNPKNGTNKIPGASVKIGELQPSLQYITDATDLVRELKATLTE